VIAEPISLQEIQSKLDEADYATIDEFVKDFKYVSLNKSHD
jgi:Bromodomain